MVKNRLFILSISILLTFPAFGKVNRYMVIFKDKNNSTFSTENPEAFLSSRAIERRAKQNISIVQNDIPVSEIYLDNLRDLDQIGVFFPSKWANGVLVEIDESRIDELKSLFFVRDVIYVAPGSKIIKSTNNGRVAKVKDITNDPFDGNQTKSQNQFIGVDAMHQMGYHGEGMLIAVFDSGFDFVDQSSYFTHLFRDNNIKGTKDFVRGSTNVFQYDSHGSKVLSCISAFSEGEYTGTAPLSDLILCVTEDIGSESRIEEYNWLFAAEYADSAGVDIINSSVGYSYFDDENMNYTYNDMDGNTTVITKAADLAASKGILVVNSIGNEGNNTWKYLNAPSDGDSVLSIGAVTYDKDRSNFSSFGPTSDRRIKPDITSLGSWVKIVYKNEITYANGTSFSSPMVAGLAAGLWQAYPHLTNMELMQYLKMTASQSDAPDTALGYGIPDFVRAFNKIKVVEGDIVNTFVVFPNPVTNRRIINFYIDPTTEQTSADLYFYDLKGSFLQKKIFQIKSPVDPVEIDVSFLNPGSYILNYMIGGEAKKSKLVVQ